MVSYSVLLQLASRGLSALQDMHYTETLQNSHHATGLIKMLIKFSFQAVQFGLDNKSHLVCSNASTSCVDFFYQQTMESYFNVRSL